MATWMFCLGAAWALGVGVAGLMVREAGAAHSQSSAAGVQQRDNGRRPGREQLDSGDAEQRALSHTASESMRSVQHHMASESMRSVQHGSLEARGPKVHAAPH